MTPERLTDCMHAVLDGSATPEQAHALDAALATDAAAAMEFAGWQSMFETMRRLPMAHPPEGLVAAISAALPRDAASAPFAALRRPTSSAEENFFAGHQLSSRDAVLASGQARMSRFSSGLRTFLHRSGRSDSTQGHGHMNANRKIWTGAAVAVVALGVVLVSTGYPPKPENVTGTVMPAERYRAPQAGADAIKLGEQGTGKPIVAPTDAAGVQAAKSETQLQADRSANQSADRAANLSADRAANLSADRGANLSADRAANLSADRAANLSADRAANLSADRGANLSADRAANLSVDRAANLSADRAANLAADRSANLSADRAANLSADRAANLSADRAANLSADRAANLAADRAANLQADRAANVRSFRATAENSAQMSADKSAQMSADKAAQMSADRAVQRSADKSVQRSAEKSAERSADKQAQ